MHTPRTTPLDATRHSAEALEAAATSPPITVASMVVDRRAAILAAAVLLTGCTSSGTSRPQAVARPGTSRRPSSRPTRAPAATSAPTPAAAAGPAVEVDRASTGRQEVALTFHGAGDAGLTRRLLAEVERRQAHVTVLAIGTWLSAHPELADRLLSAGHELGNHTMTHPVLRRLGAARIAEEIGQCKDVLTRVAGTPGAFFRPSGGSGSTAAIRAASARAGYRVLLGFDVDPRDYADPGAQRVVSRALASVRAGSVLSLHLGHPGTVAAMPALLDGLQARGLTPVTASRLLAA